MWCLRVQHSVFRWCLQTLHSGAESLFFAKSVACEKNKNSGAIGGVCKRTRRLFIIVKTMASYLYFIHFFRPMV